jgi:Zn-dependent peptidase ImmA (M78 family)
LAGWIAAVEALDILVFQTSKVAVAEMRGASISEFPFPVVLLNGSDWPRPKAFTLMHEFAHLLLHEGGICDWSENQHMERFCNRVAAGVLVPETALLQESLVSKAGGPIIWTDDEISGLSKKYAVSEEMMVLRLVSVGRATEQFYREKRGQYLRGYAVAEEERKNRPKKSGRGAPVFRKVLKAYGRPYVRTVLSALHDNRVTLSEASGYFDVRLKHLPAIESEAWRRPVADE